MIDRLLPSTLAGLIKEAECECCIDYGTLSFDEESARELVALQLLEMVKLFKSQEERELSLLVSLGHQILQNQVLNLKVFQIMEKLTEKLKLLPCPFCKLDLQEVCDDVGIEDILYGSGYDHDGMRYHIVCNECYGGCGAEMFGDTPEECIEKWNKRA